MEPSDPSPEGTACDSPARKCGVGIEGRNKSRRDGTSVRTLIRTQGSPWDAILMSGS
jgi:hypothetical protein